MKKYWPLLAIALVIAAVVGVSHYAEKSRQHCEESARQAKAAAVAKGDDGKSSDNTENACKSPVWARYFTWPEGVGALAVILTLFVVAWQSIETRAAAKATEASVELVRRQADIMESQAKDARESGAEASKTALDTLEEMRFQRKATTDALGKQTYEMGEQAAALRSSVDVARENAEAAKKSANAALQQIKAMKDRERARLVVRSMSIPELVPSLEEQKAIVVNVHVANEGATKAFNVRAYAMLDIVNNRNGGPYGIGFQQISPPPSGIPMVVMRCRRLILLASGVNAGPISMPTRLRRIASETAVFSCKQAGCLFSQTSTTTSTKSRLDTFGYPKEMTTTSIRG